MPAATIPKVYLEIVTQVAGPAGQVYFSMASFPIWLPKSDSTTQ